jgi:cytochrome c biogenesis protein CcmG/thiol:disulfide interchange protein DsbE
MRYSRAAAAVALLIVASCADRDADVGAFRPMRVGDSAPAYAVESFAGEMVRVGASGDTAQPVTVLNVWATWCSACEAEMADLNALADEFGGSGVRVVGVSVDGGNGTRVKRFAESEKLDFIVAHDPDQRVQRLYQVVGVPETFVLGENGRILFRYVGNIHPMMDSVRAILRGAIGD